MRKLILLGGGGHCKSVLDALIRSQCYDDIVITDPDLPVGSEILGCPIVGNDDALPYLRTQGFTDAFITLGSIIDTSIRNKLAKIILQYGFSVPVIADPTATVSGFSSVGEGTFLGKNAIVNAGAKIGKHCIINSGAIIEHDCRIGDFCHVAVGGIVCGGVTLGDNCFVGAGSTVIQGIKVGNNAIIGANSTVLSDVSDNEKVMGLVVSKRTSRKREHHN